MSIMKKVPFLDGFKKQDKLVKKPVKIDNRLNDIKKVNYKSGKPEKVNELFSTLNLKGI